MDFRLLGPLEVVGDRGLALSIGTGRQRALLALLILRANEPVGSDRLVNELFSHAIGEIIDARVYSGIHFRTADVQGARLGEQVARWREQHYFQPVR